MGTLGNTGTGSFTYQFPLRCYCIFTASEDGVVTSMTVRVDNTTGVSKNLNLGIYADNSGTPGLELAHGTAVSVPAGVNNITVSDVSYSISNGTNYWLCVQRDDIQVQLKFDNGAFHQLAENSGTFDTWEDNPTIAVFEDLSACIYATYSTVTVQYTSEDSATLPSTNAELSHVFDAGEYIAVGSPDGSYASVNNTLGYGIFQFEYDATGKSGVKILWQDGKSDIAPSSKTVYLQIYKVAAPAGWETLDSENGVGAGTTFTLTGTVADLTNYNSGGIIYCRVYQPT